MGEKAPRRYVRLRKKDLLLGAGILFTSISVATGLAFMYRSEKPVPLPASEPTAFTPSSLIKNVPFTAYYPAPFPAQYTYEKSTERVTAGIMFFNLANSQDPKQVIQISEQVAPAKIPDFQKLIETLSFKKVEVDAGTAVTGMNIDQPTAILLTNTTLVNISGSKYVPSDVILTVLKNMHSL